MSEEEKKVKCINCGGLDIGITENDNFPHCQRKHAMDIAKGVIGKRHEITKEEAKQDRECEHFVKKKDNVDIFRLYDVQKRVKRFFKVNSLKHPNKNHLGWVADDKGNVTDYPKDFGIHTVREWEKEVDHELEWVKKHKKEVLRILPSLRSQWSVSCAVLRKILRKGEK